MDEISVIASPNQNGRGEILINKLKYDQGIEKRSMHIFVHFCKMDENGELIPRFISREEHDLIKTSNQAIEEALRLHPHIKPIYAPVSHMDITLDSKQLLELSDKESFTDVLRQIRQWFPNCRIPSVKLGMLSRYLKRVNQGEIVRPGIFTLHSMIGRLALHVSLKTTETEIEAKTSSPLMITGKFPGYWKQVQWGEKPPLTNPKISQEVYAIAENE